MKLLDLIHKLLADAQSNPSLQNHEVVEALIVVAGPDDNISYTLQEA